MNREFLKNAGLTDEQIEMIMAEHGKDIQAEKDKAKTAGAELETYKAKIADLEKAAGDSEAVRKELDDLKAQVEAEKKAAEDAKRDADYTTAIRAALPTDKKFVNEITEQAVIAQIKTELAKPENTGKGAKEIFEAITKDKEGIFQSPQQIRSFGRFHDVPADAVDEAKARAIMGLPPVKE
ncbi:MAG: phage scaffolding protein [Flexilinea sp.]|nr:phage scaffolding protein [Flexilinea sp.]